MMTNMQRYYRAAIWSFATPAPAYGGVAHKAVGYAVDALVWLVLVLLWPFNITRQSGAKEEE